MTCLRKTGAWVFVDKRHVWSGETGEPKTDCLYTGTPAQLICHLIVTHRLAWPAAADLVDTWTRRKA